MASSCCPQACNVPPAHPNASSTAEGYGQFKEQGIQVVRVTKDQGMQAGCRSEIQQLKDSFQIPEKLPKVVIGTDFGDSTVPPIVVCDDTGFQWKHNASANLSPCMLEAQINQRVRALNCLQYKLSRLHMQIKATRDNNAKLKQQIEDLINEQSSCPNICDKSQEKPSKAVCPASSVQGCSGPCGVQKSNQSCSCPCCAQTPNQDSSGPCSGGEESDPGMSVTCKKNDCPAWQCVQEEERLSFCKLMILMNRIDKLLQDEDDNDEICPGSCNVLKQKQPCPGPCNKKTPKPKSSLNLEMSPQRSEELTTFHETCLAYRRKLTCPFPCNQKTLPDDWQPCSIKQENKPYKVECARPCNTQGLGEKLTHLSHAVSTKCHTAKNMLMDYFHPSEQEMKDSKESKCGTKGFKSKISSLLQEWPTKLNKTGTSLTNCILPTERNRPTDRIQSSGKVKRITQSSTTEEPCPLLCDYKDRISCQIDELETQVQEVNGDLETQQNLLSSLIPSFWPQDNLCIAKRTKIEPCPAYLPRQPCEPALPKCPPVSSPYLCGSSKAALRPCASKPPLPPCPPKPSTAPEGSCRCRK